MKQSQFLEVVDRDEAERRWLEVIDASPLGAEGVPLAQALGRVLAEDVGAEVDVPGFDRSNMDGFAVRAADTFGASEEEPLRLRLNAESIPTGVMPQVEVGAGTATSIATGGVLPRGADAVVPVEVTDVEGDRVVVRRAAVPGAAVSFAGTDIGAGETVLFAGTRLTSRDTGVLAAIGRAEVAVQRRPRVAIVSTGDEIVQPGEAMRPGLIFDSNGRILADAVAELGAEPWFLGAIRDDEAALRAALDRALAEADAVLLSGGTSKGEGDLNARVVEALDPGIVVHGVALKPGKPICLAAAGRKPVVILPGFPTSAIFTFHEFVAPVLRRLGGLPADRRESVTARLALRTTSERGRLEYLLVGLVRGDDGALAAYPMGKGSGSVTAFSRADGFVRVGRNTEIVEADAPVEVMLVGRELPLADLVVIGSHCAGLDRIASALAQEGFTLKVHAVGSQGGLAAAQRGECDLAPIHLLDPATDQYNEPFLGDGLRLLRGYGRMQGVVTRPDETREPEALLADAQLRMVNRNRGSGTRVLIDRLLGERRPPGFAYEPRSHYAVAAAVAQKRADWGVTIETVARQAGLRFHPLQAEHYDFAVPAARWERPALRALRRLLEPGSALRRELEALGFTTPEAP
ncbi:MAG: molybdopterin biosynthesis protein [Myxococcota bacterium]|nr:molybdopterin biosynthesis protein [Myxococcota bacterium]